MTKLQKLSDEQIQTQLKNTPEWTVIDGKLHREFQFKNFVSAFTFMTGLAFKAESLNHHPEWFNVYNRVVIDLNTHDVGGLSEFDFRFACAADELYTLQTIGSK